MTAGFVSSSRAVIRAHQERFLIERGRLFIGAMIAVIVGLWVLNGIGLMTHVASPLPFLNGIELCVLTVALTQLRRPWYRRHVLGLSVAFGVQLIAFLVLHGLWTGELWLLSLRLTALTLVMAAVLPWGVAAQGVVVAASSLGFAFVHWSLNATLDHFSTITTFVLFAVSLLIAVWVKQAHAEIATEIERRQTAEGVLRHATEGAQVAVWDADLRTRKVRLVSGWDRLLGRGENEITLVELLDLVHVEDRAKTTVALQAHVQGRKSTHDIEHRILHADGSYRWVLSRSAVACDAQGRPYRIQGAVMDITERKRLEEALQDIEARKRVEEVLRESEERYRGHFEQAAVGKAFAGLDGRYLRVNPRFCDIVGYTEPELCTRRFQDITHPDDLGRDLGAMRDMLDGKIQTYSIEKRHLRKDGSVVWIDLTVSLVRDPSGHPKYFIVVIEDIDARKRAEEMLRESEERFRATFEQAAVGIVHVGLDGRWLRVNQRLCDIVGYTEPELQWTRAFQGITHPGDLDRDLGARRDLLDGKIQTYSIEKRYLRKDGSIVWVDLTVSLVRDPSGHPKYFIVVIEDIDARKRAEDALRASEKKFQGLFESSRDAIMTLEPPSWRFTSGNPATVKMFEAKNEEEFISRGPWELSPDRQPDGRASVEKAQEMIETAMREGSHFFEWTHRRIGGEEFPADVLLTRMEQGGTVMLQATVRDITERKRAESERDRLFLFLDSIVENIPDMVFVKDAKSLEYVLFNRAGAEVFTHRRADLIGKNDYDLFPKEEADFFTEKDRAVLHNKALLDIPEEPIKTAQLGARILHTKKIPLLDGKGEPAYLLGVSEDITERKRAEEALKLHGTIVDTMSEGVCLIRASDAAIIYANARFEAMFGYGPGELDGRPVATLNASDEQSAEAVAQEIQRALRKNGAWRGEVRNRKKDGTPFWGQSSVSTFQHSQHGDVWVAVHTDITERKHAEETKNRLFEQVSAGQERLAVLSRRLMEVQEAERRHLARELHDEIGQYLTGISLILDQLKRRPLDSVSAPLGEAHKLLDDLIVRVRDLSLDLRPAMLDDLGLLPALLWLFGHFSKQTNVEIEFQHSGLNRRFQHEVETAAYRIVQEALTNVARHAGVSKARVHVSADDRLLSVMIADDGKGFDADAVLAAGATSGLSGMRERAVFAGGRLSVESGAGTGTLVHAEFQSTGSGVLGPASGSAVRRHAGRIEDDLPGSISEPKPRRDTL